MGNIDQTVNKKDLKEELSKLATKKDLEKFATKKDLGDFATKGEVRKVATDLKKVEKNLRAEILKVEEKVEVLQEGQEDIKHAIAKLQNTMDSFVGKVDTLTTENQVGTHQTRELELRVDTLENRVSKLETHSSHT